MKDVEIKRMIRYALGMLVLAAGLVLNTKTGLGASAINSVPYCLSILTGMRVGLLTSASYLVFVAAQMAILRRVRLQELLQLPLSVVFGRVMDFFDRLLDFRAQGPGTAALLLALAIFCIALGVILTVSMNLVPNPADGVVDAAARALGMEFSRVKNIFDLSMAALTCVIGLAATGGIVGMGVGTVVSALCIGPAAGVMKRRLFPVLGIETY